MNGTSQSKEQKPKSNTFKYEVKNTIRKENTPEKCTES